MKRIGRDKYMNVVEGQLSHVPPPKRIGPFNKNPRKSGRAPRKYFQGGKFDNLPIEIPGWANWRSHEQSERNRLTPLDKASKPIGARDGTTRKEREKEQMDLEKLFGNSNDDLQAIADVINAETDPRTKIVMRTYMKMILSKNCGDREMKDALKTVLEYTKAKPAIKSEIKVEEKTADEWTAALEEFDAGKAECLPKLN